MLHGNDPRSSIRRSPRSHRVEKKVERPAPPCLGQTESNSEARRAHCTVWDSLLPFWLLARPMRGVLMAMTHSRTQRSVERAVNVHDVETAS